jgi:SSS family solute:Na+ symporter
MWQFVLSFASGAGIIWILRWFWWRINAWSEFSSMICSAIVATYLKQVHPEVPFESALLIIISITVPVALLVTYLTPPVNDETLRDFYNRVRPGRWGWRRIAEKYGITRTPYLAKAFVNLLLGMALLFLINFGVGTLLLRSVWLGVGEIVAGGALGFILLKRIQGDAVPQGAEPPAPPSSVEAYELANRV